MTIIVCLLATVGITNAHNYSNSISGKLIKKDSYTGMKLIFNTYKNDQLKEVWIPVSTHTATVSENGEFTCEFTAPGADFYLEIAIFDGDKRMMNLHNTLTEERFYCERGDSLFIDIRFDSNVAKFNGNGAAKMNCQYLINETKIGRSGNLIIDDKTLTHEPKSASIYRLYKALLASKDAILECYKPIIPAKIYHRITNDMFCRIKCDLLRRIVPPNSTLVTPNMLDEGMQFLELHKGDPNSLVVIDSNELESPYRSQFILNCAFILYEKARKDKQTSLSYAEWMVEYAKSLKGKLREDFLVAMVVTRLRFYPEEFTNLMPDIFTMIDRKENNQLLKTIVETLSPKGKVMPYEFIDLDGNKISSENLKDKIVLMDFWFTGCHPCTSIPPIMKTIMERLKHQSNVVYLSISVDDTKELWQQGLKSGKYTVPGQLHVFTGEGRNSHPFLLKYDIRAYPRIILLGKNGKIIASNLEPRKDNGDETVRLIEKEFGVEN